MKMGLEKAVAILQSWSKVNVQSRKQLQAMMFPEGVFYDREMDGYRTQQVNGFSALSSQSSFGGHWVKLLKHLVRD